MPGVDGLANRDLLEALLGVPLAQEPGVPAAQRADDRDGARADAFASRPCSILGEASLLATGQTRDRMASGAPALVAEPLTIGVAFEGPLVTLAKWAITAVLWAQAFNWTVVFATYGFEGAFKHWYELLFFPITIIYRHAVRGVQRAIKPSIPKKCSWAQRMLLGGQYCERVEKAAETVAALQRSGALDQAQLNRCGE